ncbi:MAG: hypothetical protein PHR77_21830, partial [Kiritimatiellae bacterium]|nr:hypothetical protein [Kiritimatiellia bacterium]
LLDSFTEIPVEILLGSTEQDSKAIAKSRVALRKTLEASISRSKNAIGEACSTLLKAIEMDPENPIVRNELLATLSLSAESMFSAGELVQTALQSELILKYQPDDFWALYRLFNLSMRANHPERAKGYLARGLAKYPKSPLFMALRGRYRGSMGDVVGACSDLRAALDELPGKSDVWDDYIFFLKACGNSTGVTKAKTDAARALSL